MKTLQLSTIIAMLLLLVACDTTKNEHMHDYTNDLINETSPYLLQHAHNPVNWKPWSEETLAQAKKENKLILVSIGYSSCHWCHVMEHESFEDTLVANLMNEHFISIKVDREERPDIDAIYMNAVQLITGRGGWPLNAVALPDGRPFWGGTYFPKDDWVDALQQIAKRYKEDPNEIVAFADKLTQGLKEVDIVKPNPNKPVFVNDSITTAIQRWSRSWDTRQGGTNREPKFMMPNNYQFLLRYAKQTNDTEILEFVNTTLTQIAYGGINDQIGGGFSRYSTDMKWHVPHFEKMLYDNAQLVSLYSDAYLATANTLYEETVHQTLRFIAREMTSPEGGFYSALDADSLTAEGELEEGAYYVWTIPELKEILKEDFDVFAEYFNINSYGKWEKDNYVLIRQDSDTDFIKEHNLERDAFLTMKKKWQEDLLRFRESERTYPRMDDKILTGWNGLMLKGYIDAYRVFQKKEYLNIALKNANFIATELTQPSGALFRTHKEGNSTLTAYLEDYAAVIDAYIALFETTADVQWLNKAKNLADYTLAHFKNEENGMFYFTSDESKGLVTRTTEVTDNVIPASNSIMAKNFFKLSHYFLNRTYTDTAVTMLNNVQGDMAQYPTAYSNWLDLLLNFTQPYYEIIVVGPEADERLRELEKQYIPNALLAASTIKSESEIFKGRYLENETLIYVCVNNACKLPVSSVSEALKLLKN